MLKFWGTRGSCSVSGPEYSHFGGNTSCMELQYGDSHMIIDAGTGIRPLGLTLRDRKKIDLFISHFHWDHIIGFPFFEPIYREDVQITIRTPRQNGRLPQELFEELHAKEFFPIPLDMLKSHLIFQVLEENTPMTLGSLQLNFHKTIHPSNTFGYKIKTGHQTIGYVTDNEISLETKSLIDFFKGVDIFVHEAQYSSHEYSTKQGWGHSNLNAVMDLVREIRPGKWLVVHHDPEHSDAELREMEKMARASHLPCPVEWIGDGHVLNLT